MGNNKFLQSLMGQLNDDNLKSQLQSLMERIDQYNEELDFMGKMAEQETYYTEHNMDNIRKYDINSNDTTPNYQIVIKGDCKIHVETLGEDYRYYDIVEDCQDCEDGWCIEHDVYGEDEQLAGINDFDLYELDGVEHDCVFSDYFSPKDKWGDNEDCLINKGVVGGNIVLKAEEGKLYVVHTYTSREELNSDELNILLDYTQGQDSDGAGEGFEQRPLIRTSNCEISVSPWHSAQKLTITQTKIENE